MRPFESSRWGTNGKAELILVLVAVVVIFPKQYYTRGSKAGK